MHSDTDRAADALHYLDAGCDRETWHKTGRAGLAAGLPIEVIDAWSATGGNYKGTQDVTAAFRTVKPEGGTGAGTLFFLAREAGWTDGKTGPQRQAPAQTRPTEPTRKPAPPGMAAADVWSRCEAATNAHGYILGKGATSVPLDTLRVVPAGDTLRIAGQRMAGFLMVPAYAPDGELQSAQFIPPGGGKKLNLPGASMAGAAFTVGPPDGPAHLCEGIGAAWAVWLVTGQRAVVCFGWGNVRRVAEAMRERDAAARLILCPDAGKERDAAKIAADVGAAVAAMPPGWPDNSDAHDLAQAEGYDVLALLLESATEPPIVYPLSVAFAHELPDTYEPPDELVQGVLTAGDGSVLYGDSNSGKTFFVIDMAAAVARGVDWMDRKTEPGLVVYLAAESPASVRGRLQAYQKHHGVKVPNFAIVQSPIDLFDGDADTNKVIKLVKMLEAQCGQPVRLIIGDTLARLSAGANENAGQDMGLVVRRFDRIRTECKAHFLLIHHSGKAVAAGARGWSGIRAAVDTEIEVTDSPAGRCCEITKQRDLPTKGDRIGFRLDVVTLGHTKWGAPATSCVVVPSDAPAKQTGKRMGECDGAVLEFLVAHKIGIRKTEVVKHFEGRYERGPIYRAIKSLVTAAAVHEAAGMVCAAEVAK
jgi:putative DNA primase/helicase